LKKRNHIQKKGKPDIRLLIMMEIIADVSITPTFACCNLPNALDHH
jgi:hypothetical protein